jgi:hypothetical protein
MVKPTRARTDVSKKAKVAADASPRTRTLPDGERGVWFDGPDEVTVLRVDETGHEFELPRNVKMFSIGSAPDCDLSLPREFISGLHCIVERYKGALRVRDQESHNGTYFGGRKLTTFDARPGDTFNCAQVRFLVLSDQMRACLRTLEEIVGSKEEHGLPYPITPSGVLATATEGGNLVITGEPGCDQERLARTIHTISLRRNRPIVELDRIPDDRDGQRAILDRASRTTLVLKLDDASPVIDPTFASMMFSPSYTIRTIVIAPSLTKAHAALGIDSMQVMGHVWLLPLRHRPKAIRPMLDRALVELGATFEASSLTVANQAALAESAWPENLSGLRVAAERLIALQREGSIRKAAEALGMSASSLHYWYTQLGLSVPLVATT